MGQVKHGSASLELCKWGHGKRLINQLSTMWLCSNRARTRYGKSGITGLQISFHTLSYKAVTWYWKEPPKFLDPLLMLSYYCETVTTDYIYLAISAPLWSPHTPHLLLCLRLSAHTFCNVLLFYLALTKWSFINAFLIHISPSCPLPGSCPSSHSFTHRRHSNTLNGLFLSPSIVTALSIPSLHLYLRLTKSLATKWFSLQCS